MRIVFIQTLRYCYFSIFALLQSSSLRVLVFCSSRFTITRYVFPVSYCAFHCCGTGLLFCKQLKCNALFTRVNVIATRLELFLHKFYKIDDLNNRIVVNLRFYVSFAQVSPRFSWGLRQNFAGYSIWCTVSESQRSRNPLSPWFCVTRFM